MTETLASEILTNAMLYFGGPAVIIAIASGVSAFNSWKARKVNEAILMELRRREL